MGTGAEKEGGAGGSDQVHRLRLYELASRERPQAYRRQVLRFALLGYGLLLGLVLAALGGLAWLGLQLGQGARPAGWMVWLGLSCLGLLWAGLRGLQVPFEPPAGEALSAAEAPELFQALERMRAKLHGPRIDRLLISDDFNAAIVQQPLWLGLRHRNHLVLGWPLLAALEPRRVMAVIAHEYGHLRGAHGKLSAWIYRTRLAWGRLWAHYREGGSLLGWLLGRFAAWYFPRFDALSFALARQDEYEADRMAARLLGAEVAAHALQEVALKAQWYEREFWPRWWRRARADSLRHSGIGPYAGMGSVLQRPLAPEWAQAALRRELRRLANFDDTHPVLKDRLASLGQPSAMPPFSAGHALRLLGTARERIGQALDAHWWQQHRADWRRHGERLLALEQEARELAQRAASLDADEWLRWAEAMRALSDKDVSPWLERALQRSPGHAEALAQLAALHAPSGDPRVDAWLECLHEQHAERTWQAAMLARQWLEVAGSMAVPPARQRLWRERLAAAEARERVCWERFAALPPWEQSQPAGLDEAALRRLRSLLLRQAALRGAWLGVQRLDGVAHYSLWLEARGLDAAARQGLGQQLLDAAELPGRARVVWLGAEVERARLPDEPRGITRLLQRR